MHSVDVSALGVFVYSFIFHCSFKGGILIVPLPDHAFILTLIPSAITYAKYNLSAKGQDMKRIGDKTKAITTRSLRPDNRGFRTGW